LETFESGITRLFTIIADVAQETVRDTIESMANALDVRAHPRRHPWLN